MVPSADVLRPAASLPVCGGAPARAGGGHQAPCNRKVPPVQGSGRTQDYRTITGPDSRQGSAAVTRRVATGKDCRSSGPAEGWMPHGSLNRRGCLIAWGFSRNAPPSLVIGPPDPRGRRGECGFCDLERCGSLQRQGEWKNHDDQPEVRPAPLRTNPAAASAQKSMPDR